MMISVFGLRVGLVLTVATLCSIAAGCTVDLGTTKPERADGGGAMRYYGGPKSPMWSSQ